MDDKKLVTKEHSLNHETNEQQETGQVKEFVFLCEPAACNEKDKKEQQTAYIKGYGRDFAEIFNYPAALIEAEGFAFNKNNRYLQGDNPTSEDR